MARGLGRRLLGAAAVGLGSGIVANVQAQRKEALEDLRFRNQMAVAEFTAGAADDRAAATRAHEIDMWEREQAAKGPTEHKYDTDAAGNKRWVTGPNAGQLVFTTPEGGAIPATPDLTTEQKNIRAFLERNPTLTEADYWKSKRAPGTTVTVGTGDQKPARAMSAVWDPLTQTAPAKDYVFEFDFKTGEMKRGPRGLPIEVPRGKHGTKAEELAAKTEGQQVAQEREADSGLKRIEQIEKHRAENPHTTTGLLGTLFGFLPGDPAHDIKKTIETLDAQLGFNELADMRKNSPTGGAVGSLSERELDLLSSKKVNLVQSQSGPQFDANLAELKAQHIRTQHIGRMLRGMTAAEREELAKSPRELERRVDEYIAQQGDANLVPAPERFNPISAPATQTPPALPAPAATPPTRNVPVASPGAGPGGAGFETGRTDTLPPLPGYLQNLLSHGDEIFVPSFNKSLATLSNQDLQAMARTVRIARQNDRSAYSDTKVRAIIEAMRARGMK